VTENEYGEYEIRIDWEAINAVKDEEEGQKIEDSISDLEGWRDDINEQNDTIEDIYDEIQEIRHQGEDEYFDLETRIKDALVQA
jgi:flagellar capping protein FliD